VEIHPDDGRDLGVAQDSLVRVSSRRGEITLKVRLVPFLNPGAIFIPFHFREAAANVLTIDALDPDGKIPEYKFCAVKVEPLRD
jgi:formate dehydrogenase major subunit